MIVVIVILILSCFNLCTSVINDLLSTIKIFKYSELNSIFTFTSEFYTIVYFMLLISNLSFQLEEFFNISYKASLVVMILDF